MPQRYCHVLQCFMLPATKPGSINTVLSIQSKLVKNFIGVAFHFSCLSVQVAKAVAERPSHSYHFFSCSLLLVSAGPDAPLRASLICRRGSLRLHVSCNMETVSNRTLKKPHQTRPPMNKPTCFCEKSPSPCDEEKSVNLSQSWLNHVFRLFFCPANRRRLPCPNFRQQMRCSRVDSVLPVPDVKPLHPPSDVLVGINSNTTVILATFPPESPRCHAFQNHTCRVPSDTTQSPPGVGMTHPRERLPTTGAASQRNVASRQEVMACLVSSSCEPASGL